MRPFAFYFFEVQYTLLVSSSLQGEDLCWFDKGKEETFAVSLQNRKSCVCIKYLTLARPRKLIAENFTFLYSM